MVRSRSDPNASIDEADRDDIDGLIVLQHQLFVEDAGRHDTFVDLTWPEREGRHDFEHLLGDDSSIVLAARREGELVGYLVGYRAPSSPTRHDVFFGVVRSLFVEPGSRRSGVGDGLIERFLAWARAHDCAEAHVTSYVANPGAQRLYQRRGFEARSVVRVLDLETDA